LSDFLKKDYPNYKTYNEIDFRNSIAKSWPANILTTNAEMDWGMTIDYDKINTL